MTREQLEHQQIPLYFVVVLAAAVLGLTLPALAAHGEWLISPALALLMYVMFLQLPLFELRQGLRQARFLAALLMANFVFVPLLVWLASRSLLGHPALLIGALLVLLTPCIDYVVVFTQLGKGDASLTLAATPLLLLVQLLLLPLYLALMVDTQWVLDLPLTPFVEAFVGLIAVPLGLALLTLAAARRQAAVAAWSQACSWLPVPAMALVLLLVVGSQSGKVAADWPGIVPVLPVYLGFAVLAPALGLLTARLWRLPPAQTRSLMFSSATRNSLVVLPLALALPAEMRSLAAAAVVCQTLVELLAELAYIRLLPRLVRG
ncbi:bile acid:sodium symporter [Pseudomonas cremoricolorata]|uniref:Arsenic resistance protein n=1 Tax=Pseudomonas cremoricolorata TaxID=157783 RepID=A0A089WJQ4_9PSED|nr:bile acid:sodium symporter [Pseudomonas cremoricolorata]AIR89535.1 arsenic resistance protein [Pseudomonas cremoricolorata]